MTPANQPTNNDTSNQNNVILNFNSDNDTIFQRMDRSTIQVFSSLDDYITEYGPFVDRLGLPSGKYLWHLPPNGRPYSFEKRALEIQALNDPYYQYEIKQLPSGFFIRTGINVPQFGLPGGARQVQFLAGTYTLTAAECTQLGILDGKAAS